LRVHGYEPDRASMTAMQPWCIWSRPCNCLSFWNSLLSFFIKYFFFVASKYLNIDKYVLRLTTPSCSIGLHYLCASIVQFYVSACICAVKLFSFLWTVDQKGENSETKLRDLQIVNGCGFSLNILDNPVC
jgi:hypothetical protein